MVLYNVTTYLILFTLFLWCYFLWSRSYFQRCGIQTLPYYVPFVGHMVWNLLQKEHMKDAVDRLYKAFPNQRYIGFQQLITPVITVKDPDLIKQVTIQDFEYFQDRVTRLDESVDSVFGAHLVSLTGQKWHDMRVTLSPTFTSSKMRGMFDFVEECAEQTVDFVKNEIKMAKDGVFCTEMKSIYRRYANDVIASTAFGLKINTFKDFNNTFYKIGEEAIDFSGTKLAKFMLASAYPTLFKALGISMMDERITSFYRKLVKDTMNERISKHITRPDMIHLLMEAQKGTLKHEKHKDDVDTGFSTVEESSLGKVSVKRKWTDDDITAQAVLFLLAGFDSTAGTLSFLSYELAINPDIQNKLVSEIENLLEQTDGRMTYADLNNLVYLDMVVSETLRKYPSFVFVDRICVKKYLLPAPSDDSGRGHLMAVGEGIQIPIYSIHHDPQYYPNPEKFEPERFSFERRKDIKPYTYLPFGIGPRNCIGSRFALMEIKVIIYNLIKCFEFVPIEKTEIPLQFKSDAFNLTAKNGFWVGFKIRQ